MKKRVIHVVKIFQTGIGNYFVIAVGTFIARNVKIDSGLQGKKMRKHCVKTVIIRIRC